MNAQTSRVSRRSMLAGFGVAAGAGALLVAGPADAATPGGSTPGPAGPHPDLVPPGGLSPISSAPLSGYTYKFVSMFDFTPENFANGRAWTLNGGTYCPLGGSGVMWAGLDVPPGAVLCDVEWYVAATVETELMARIWAAGAPQLGAVACDGIIPASTAGGVRAVRVIAPTASNGPYPHGTRLNLGLRTYADKSVVVNGARVGFTAGAGEIGLLPTPVRAYDSRTSGGRLAAGSTRTITLPAALVQPGTSGVLVNITAVGATQSGYLKVYPGNASAPAASALNFSSSGATIANAITVGVSSARQIKVFASKAVHVVVDVTGTVG